MSIHIRKCQGVSGNIQQKYKNKILKQHLVVIIAPRPFSKIGLICNIYYWLTFLNNHESTCKIRVWIYLAYYSFVNLTSSLEVFNLSISFSVWWLMMSLKTDPTRNYYSIGYQGRKRGNIKSKIQIPNVLIRISWKEKQKIFKTIYILKWRNS